MYSRNFDINTNCHKKNDYVRAKQICRKYIFVPLPLPRGKKKERKIGTKMLHVLIVLECTRAHRITNLCRQ